MTSNLILKWKFKSQNSVMETNTIMYNKICISPYIAFSKKNQYDIITFSISYELCTHFFVKWLFTPLSPKINSIMSNEPVLERYLLMFIFPFSVIKCGSLLFIIRLSWLAKFTATGMATEYSFVASCSWDRWSCIHGWFELILQYINHIFNVKYIYIPND